MAVELQGFNISWLKSTADYRNSAIQGTTYSGPNGSAQFLAVTMSTAGGGDGYFALFGATIGVPLGILQDKPAAGGAGNIMTLGVSKVVAAATTILPGSYLMPTTAGTMTLWSAGAGFAMARSLETPGTAGAVFSAVLFGGAYPST